MCTGQQCSRLSCVMSTQQHVCSCVVLFLITLVGTACSGSDWQQHISLQRDDLQNKMASASIQQHSRITHQKGIVFPCGGARQLANAYVGLLIIRNYLFCDLPVEIAYYGTNEMDDYHKALFQAIHATALVDLSSVKRFEYKTEFPVSCYASKAFAIIHSSFAEILCLDSDNIPLRNPLSLFETASYQQHGNIFWSDPNINGLDPTVYEMFDLQPPWAEDASFLAAESGQILLNRQKHLDVLHWLWFVTANSDYFYPRMHGDKDTYRMAFALAGKANQYNQVRAGPQLGLAPWKHPEGLFYISAGFVQPDFNSTPVFYHRVEAGAKLNPESSFVLNPVYVTSTLSHSWRRPEGTVWFDPDCGGGGGGVATHYPANRVNISAYQQCCPRLSFNSTYSSCTCQLTSSDNSHMMIAVPLAYFSELQKVIAVSHQIFTTYQHNLWEHQHAAQLT